MDTTEQNELLSIQEASTWASSYMKRVVTESNISYLIQYGRVRKIGKNDFEELGKIYPDFATIVKTQKIKVIFSKFRNWIFSHFKFIILKTQYEYNFST